MIASTKGRYALRVLADMAESAKDGEFVALKDIAARQEISEKYLEAIMKILVENKLVVGHRGKGGGYRLVKAPEEYSVGEIIRAAEGDIAPVACLAPGAEKCDRYDTCKTVAMWEKLDTIISDYLDGIKLTDLISG
ncbi:MAG: Rrf2 family transcriptional regulator [Saccharofermentans sp.]|jgi:Rrf2 family protein|nr:Rrf2 family transcriptional regulator [Saccharofermentans sp.]